ELYWLYQRVRRQNLQCHATTQCLLHRFIDDAHSAATDFTDDAILAQTLELAICAACQLPLTIQLLDQRYRREKNHHPRLLLLVTLVNLADRRLPATSQSLGKLFRQLVNQIVLRVVHGWASEMQRGDGEVVRYED